MHECVYFLVLQMKGQLDPLRHKLFTNITPTWLSYRHLASCRWWQIQTRYASIIYSSYIGSSRRLNAVTCSREHPRKRLVLRPVPGTRVPGYPTDESGTRFRFYRFYYPNRKFYFNKRDKQDKQEDLPLETATHFVGYALPIQLSRCNDHDRLWNRVQLCQDWQLLCVSVYFRVPGYPTVTGIRWFQKYP